MERISWIGSGNVGQTLAKAMSEAGYEIGYVYSRKLENVEKAVEFIGAGQAASDLIAAALSGTVHFIVTKDDAIAGIVEEIAAQGPASLTGHYYFHTSGSLSSAVLEPLQKKGASIGSIHPLQVFADPQKAINSLPGTYYAIEGDDRAMSLAVQIVGKLNGHLLLIPTGRKVLYHIACVFASNYLTALVNYSMSIMEDIGETPEDAYQALLPLMVGALESIESLGVSEALTGPIVRGDVDTVRRHLGSLPELRPELLEAYKVLGKEALDIAVRSGRVSTEKGHDLYTLLDEK